MRGYVSGCLKVKVLEQGQHSGAASGVVPSSFRILRMLLDRLEDSATGEINENFQVQIPDLRYSELFDVAKNMGYE